MTCVLCGVVGTACQRACFHMNETHGKGLGFEAGKVGRLVKPGDRDMRFGRLQVLADRDDVASRRPQIAKYLPDFFRGLSHSDDEA